MTSSHPVPFVWYEQLRTKHRPSHLRVLLIGESPPQSGEGALRFFYSPVLTRHDNLYRGVAQALYGEREDVDVSDKSAVLARIQSDGFWLIDAVDEPINKKVASARRKALRDGVAMLVERCIHLAPKVGVIICHDKVCKETATALRNGGVRVLHAQPLPFPLGNTRARFVTGFRKALATSTFFAEEM